MQETTEIWYAFPAWPEAICKQQTYMLNGQVFLDPPSYHCPKCGSEDSKRIATIAGGGGFDCVSARECECGQKFILRA